MHLHVTCVLVRAISSFNWFQRISSISYSSSNVKIKEYTKASLSSSTWKLCIDHSNTHMTLNSCYFSLSWILTAMFTTASVTLSDHIKLLDITLDNRLSFDKHVSNVCSISYFHIRALRHFRTCLA